MTVTLVSVPDPTLCEFPLPLERTFYPLGFAVRISTNSPEIVQAATEVWGSCERVFDEEPVQLRLAVDPACTEARPPAAMPRAQGHLFCLVHSARNFATADLSRGYAFGWFTPAMVADRGHFRYHFLESLGYAMLSALYLTPIHAACVNLRGGGMLLWGPSGAGKTSLAYACAKRGWEFVTDDGSYLVRKSTGEPWIAGRPHDIRFRDTARSLFPELATRTPCLRMNGKLDIEVPSAELGILKVAQAARVGTLVILNRQAGGPAQLRPYPKEDALALLEQTICFGDERVRQAQRQSLKSLTKLPVFELTYSGLEDAERRLRLLVEDQISG
jgi:hypothetical protein